MTPLLRTLLALIVGASFAQAQCTVQVNAFTHPTGVDFGGPAAPLAIVSWDPDGPGPQVGRLVVAGQFIGIDGDPVQHIAMHDPLSGNWQQLGSSITGPVEQTGVAPTGELVTIAQHAFTIELAVWNGASWTVIQTPTSPRSFAYLANGDLAVVGSVPFVPWQTRVDIFDGSSWTMLPSLNAAPLRPLGLPNGDMIVTVAQSTNFDLAIWNGSNWTTSTGPFPVWGFDLSASNSLIAWGNYNAAIGTVIMQADDFVRGAHPLPNGDVLFSGYFTALNGIPTGSIARYGAGSVQPIGSGLYVTGEPVFDAVDLPSGDLVACGWFSGFNGIDYSGLARFDGNRWRPFREAGFDAEVRAVLSHNGQLYCGGSFLRAHGRLQPYLATYSAGAWQSLGGGVNDSVNALIELASGDIIAAGAFTTADGLPASRIASWNGSTWSPLGAGLNGEVHGLTTTSSGDLIAVGAFTQAGSVSANGVALWNGNAWQPLGGGVNGVARAVRADGADIYVGGSFSMAGTTPTNNIARWNGNSWHSLGNGVNDVVLAMTHDTSGTLIAAGNFNTAGGIAVTGIASWNGSQWSSLGAAFAMTEPVRAVWLQPDGAVLASHATVTGYEVSRYDGSWSSFAAFDGAVHAFTDMGLTKLICVGEQSESAGVYTGNVAEFATPCPAWVTPIPVVCGPTGTPTWSASGLPWLGTTIDLVGTGFANPQIAVALFGYTLTPTSLAGAVGLPSPCQLLSSIDVVHPTLATGTVTVPLTIPNNSALGGFRLHSHVVALDPQFQTSNMSSGLTLRIGSWQQ